MGYLLDTVFSSYLFLSFLLICVFVLVAYFIFYQKETSSKNNKNLKTIEDQNRALAATKELNNIILQTLDFSLLSQRIADAIPKFLGYQTGVLAIVDEKKGVLRRTAISATSGGKAALESLEIPFGSIEISLNDNQNYCIRALKENKILYTTQLYDVLRPVVSEENSKKVQLMMETKTTLVYPIYSLDPEKRPLGTFLVSMGKNYQEISQYELDTISNFVDGVKIALVNASLFTRLKNTGEQLEQANNKLKELDKLKDDFVSIASHELRTPMTAIRSYAWMALNRSDIPLSDKLRKYLERTLISTERLINLVNDMLNISRIESGQIDITPLPFNVGILVKDVLTEVETKASEKNIHLSVQESQLPQIFADPDKVHQILLNLIGNALKFTPQDGQIGVSFFTDGQMLDVSVKDSGVGISKDDQSRLFSKFGRLDNSYVAAATSGGTGLGLYICKSLVELMKGKIWANSEGSGLGTTFTFSLPIANQQVLQNAAQYAKQPQGEVKGLEPVAI